MTRHEYLDGILPRPTDIPMLPPGVEPIMRMLEDPTCSGAELCAAIMSSPAVTNKVLTLANLTFHGANRKITNVPAAVMMMGLSTVKYGLLSAAVFDMFRTSGSGPKLPELWTHSVATGS